MYLAGAGRGELFERGALDRGLRDGDSRREDGRGPRRWSTSRRGSRRVLVAW